MTDALLHPVCDASYSAPDITHREHPPITVERVSPAAVSLQPQRGDNYKCDTRIWKCLFIYQKGDLNLGNPSPQSSPSPPSPCQGNFLRKRVVVNIVNVLRRRCYTNTLLKQDMRYWSDSSHNWDVTP